MRRGVACVLLVGLATLLAAASASAGVDSDGDGVPDSSDLCPDYAAATENGCPPPAPGDMDGDGVLDGSDQCPTRPATTTNGCPEGIIETRDPTLEARAAERQDVDRLSIRVTSDEASTLVGTGTVKVPDPRRRLWKFKKVTKTVTADQTVRLRFKLAPRALKQVKNALEDGTQKARLQVTATDAAGNVGQVRQNVNLRD